MHLSLQMGFRSLFFKNILLQHYKSSFQRKALRTSSKADEAILWKVKLNSKVYGTLKKLSLDSKPGLSKLYHAKVFFFFKEILI